MLYEVITKADGGDAVVYEKYLEEGTAKGEGAVKVSGTFTLDAPDGIATLSINGVSFTLEQLLLASPESPLVVTTSLGNTLQITDFLGTAQGGTVSYTYSLLDNEQHVDDAGINSLYDDITLVLTYADEVDPA